MAKANDKQVGGTHYKAHGSKEIQHWDVVEIFELDYFQGNISKYVFRWRNKGGIDDLKKAMHYLEKYIEIEEAKSDAELLDEDGEEPTVAAMHDAPKPVRGSNNGAPWPPGNLT